MRSFFNPKSVAIVGASDDLSKYGGRALRTLLDFGYGGEIYPINPRRSHVQQLPAYRSLSDAPRGIEHIAVAVPAAMVPDTLIEAAEVGVRFATVFSAGFGESSAPEGKRLEAELQEICRTRGVRVMGPNCNGVVSFVNKFTLTSTMTVRGEAPAPGRIGLISQSGGLGQVNVMWRAQQAGLRFSHVLACGNDADLTVLDFLEFMIGDEETDVVTMVVERIADGPRLAELAGRAAAADKPIIALKLGRTAQGSRVASSHTGALTGTDAVFEAVFAQLGIIRVFDTPELYQIAMLLEGGRRYPAGGLGAVAVSGGNVALLADLAGTRGLAFDEFAPSTKQRLATVLGGGHAAPGNPVDLTAAAVGDRTAFRQAIELIGADPNVAALVPVLTITSPNHVDDVLEVTARVEKPSALLWTGGCTDPRYTQATTVSAGLPTFRDVAPLVSALRAAQGWTAFHNAGSRAPAPPADPARIAAARELLARAEEGQLDQATSRALLGLYGLPVLGSSFGVDEAEVVDASTAVGFPLVLKVESPDLPHKSDVGGVALDIGTVHELRDAYRTMAATVAERAPRARVDGYLLEAMAAPGIEMLLGVSPDVTFGPVITIGMGGTAVELVKDVTHILPVFAAAEVEPALRRVRGAVQLNAHRGRPAADVAALQDVVVKLSQLANELAGQVVELDLNPVIIHPIGDGVSIADTLVRTSPAD